MAIIPPRILVVVWTALSSLNFVACISFGVHAGRGVSELLQRLSAGESIALSGGLLVTASALTAVFCLWASIYAVFKIRELLEG